MWTGKLSSEFSSNEKIKIIVIIIIIIIIGTSSEDGILIIRYSKRKHTNLSMAWAAYRKTNV